MSPLLMIVLGLIVLAAFCFGGHVAGNGDHAHVASAARVFVLPWIIIAVINVWIRWWEKSALADEFLWLLPNIAIPVGAAFAIWRRYRRHDR